MNSVEKETVLPHQTRPQSFAEKSRMNKLGFVTALFFILALFNPALAITGTLAVEGGAIAITLILIAVLVSAGIGLGTCVYKNDLCTCGRKQYDQV